MRVAQDAQAGSYALLRAVFCPSVSEQDSSLWLGSVSLQVKIKSSRPRLYSCGLLRSCQCHAWARWTWHPHGLYGAICEVRCLVHCHTVCPKKPTPIIPPFSTFSSEHGHGRTISSTKSNARLVRRASLEHARKTSLLIVSNCVHVKAHYLGMTANIPTLCSCECSLGVCDIRSRR